MKNIIFLMLLFLPMFISADDWWGQLFSPSDLHMTSENSAFYYGLLGIVCGYSFVHHFRSF